MNSTQRHPRLFRLVRHVHASGIRGTGTLAEGVQWSDGAVALRWRGRWPSTSTWDDGIDALLAAHGNGGRTQIHWIPGSPHPAPSRAGPVASRSTQSAVLVSPLWLPAPALDGCCARCGRPWPCPGLCP
ncbi:hypothetical protein ACIBL3_20275 [Kribbella sp. NPDC050124]|uniref:hypothetical protein n=1 Tax=Kribbella sp. NPDC050124 TaxID=3364114 RepID=UPI0037A09890